MKNKKIIPSTHAVNDKFSAHFSLSFRSPSYFLNADTYFGFFFQVFLGPKSLILGIMKSLR